MADYILPTDSIESHRLRSALLKFSVSAAGTDQLLTGHAMTDAADRRALLELFGQLLKQATGGQIASSCGGGGGSGGSGGHGGYSFTGPKETK